jgi:hypothetical protein
MPFGYRMHDHARPHIQKNDDRSLQDSQKKTEDILDMIIASLIIIVEIVAVLL